MKNKAARKTKKTTDRPIFDAVRKPLAPPSRTLSKNKPDEKAHPSRRKAKHKQAVTADE